MYTYIHIYIICQLSFLDYESSGNFYYLLCVFSDLFQYFTISMNHFY